MTELTEVREVPRPIEEVFAYIADFSTTAEYDPGIVSAHRKGPVGKDAQFHVEARFMGQTLPMAYTCTLYESPTRLEFRGESSGSKAHDRIVLQAIDGGTQIRWNLQLELTGTSRWLEVFLRPALRRMGRKALDGLTQRLHDPRGLSTHE